jgi:hypothetical protein
MGVALSAVSASSLGLACGTGTADDDEPQGGSGPNGAGGSVSAGGDGDGGGEGGESNEPDDPPLPRENIDAFLAGLSDWPEPPKASSVTSAPIDERRNLETEEFEEWPFDCAVVKHDITEQHEEILNFDGGAEYVKPGLLLVGDEFLKGNLAPIPLKRAAITLSINVPGVSKASVTVTNPNSSTIQDGIAKLQAEAEEAAEGSYAAQLSYDQHTVQSVEEMKVKLGVSAGFDGLFASASFSSKFENESSIEKYTVVSNLRQQMYTITFAQDALTKPRDFFDPSVSLDDFVEAESDGFLGRSNVPVFISSVTYGRMVVFSATSTQAASRSLLQATLEASGTNWSASADLSVEQKDFLSSLDIEVLSIGGNQEDATNAIRTGNWTELFAGADILNSVPLRYTVRALSGTRPIAAIGDTTRYTVSDCTAIEGWYETEGPNGMRFTDVSTNADNDPIMVVGEVDGTYSPYQIDGPEVKPIAGFAKLGPLDVAVDDIGNTYLWDSQSFVLNKLPLGGTAWSSYPDGRQDILQWDAGAQDVVLVLSATYSDNQNNILRFNWGEKAIDWIDEAQNMKTNQPPYFASVGTGYVGRHGGEFGYRAEDGGWTQYTGDTDELNTVERYTAASANEVYAVRIATGEVVKFDAATKKFTSYAAAPSGKSITLVEATSNGRLWAITSDGSLYAYAPKREAPAAEPN